MMGMMDLADDPYQARCASFSLRLSTHLISQAGSASSNLAFSALSLHSLLGLLAAGSSGPTHQQLLSFLGFPLASELTALHSQISNVILADGSAAGGPCLRYASGFWVNDSLTLKSSFREVGGSVYKAEAHSVPFLRKGQDSRQFSFYIFLPYAFNGLSNLSMKMSSEPDFLNRHMPKKTVPVGDFRIPKFKISDGMEFSKMFASLGLDLPFKPTRDFSEMVDSPEFSHYKVSQISHKCFVEVDEEGTEAAAASAVECGMYCTSVEHEEPVDFVADHPFLFLIREDQSGLVLFMGHLLNPVDD
ncbi:hypothetical protein LUZ61_002766 [Rhynchospora tenuis]|uniref:Serpin domain-containing protein n=1 Tax=Rhynchospora tenuis TaxID=198213 RepID=A0AAD5ZJI1_9POAL|nr:hypothetical protein LUZ61_002766 [Rhynchospora tenuis]